MDCMCHFLGRITFEFPILTSHPFTSITPEKEKRKKYNNASSVMMFNCQDNIYTDSSLKYRMHILSYPTRGVFQTLAKNPTHKK